MFKGFLVFIVVALVLKGNKILFEYQMKIKSKKVLQFMFNFFCKEKWFLDSSFACGIMRRA